MTDEMKEVQCYEECMLKAIEYFLKRDFKTAAFYQQNAVYSLNRLEELKEVGELTV